MKKLLLRALACLLVVLSASTASGISDAGDPSISRLWAVTDKGDKFVCTVSYIFPHISDQVAWVVTAGHCAGGRYVKRNHTINVLGAVNWRATLLGDPRYTEVFTDLAIGTVPDTRPDVNGQRGHLWLAAEMPKSGKVYIHGFPAGIERVSLGEIIPDMSPKLTGSVLLAVKAGEVLGGSSGSPVLGEDGRVVAILWGLVPAEHVDQLGLPGHLAPGYDIVAVTPVERLHELMKVLRVKP